MKSVEKSGKPTKPTYTKKERVSHGNGGDSSQGRQTPKRLEGKRKEIKSRREIARHNNGVAKEINLRRIEEEGGSRE